MTILTYSGESQESFEFTNCFWEMPPESSNMETTHVVHLADKLSMGWRGLSKQLHPPGCTVAVVSLGRRLENRTEQLF